MCGVVECTVPKGVGLFEAAPDENQRRAGDFLFLDLLPDRFQCRVDIGLVGPAHTVGHDDRAVGTIERNEVAFDLAQVADRKMDGKRRTRASEAGQFFTRRHRRGFHRRAGEDQGLRHLGHREFNAKAGGSGGIGRHPGDNLIIDTKRLQAADLLGNGAV